jgi:aarF domain-containing kinase
MAGRRLVDAAKLFNASKSIAQKHIALRSQQYDLFTQTSSLAKAVKNQTDRVTLTAAAAIALSQRFNQEAPSYAKAAQPATDIPRKETTQKTPGTDDAHVQEGLEQDHHYARSGENTAVRPPPDGELHVEQNEAQRRPLPDGTIPSGGLTLEQQEKGQDTFSRRPVSEAPKEPLDGNGLEPVESTKSTIPLPGQPAGASTSKFSDTSVQDDLPEGINTDVFHSKRVARMLGQDRYSRKENPYLPKGNPHIPSNPHLPKGNPYIPQSTQTISPQPIEQAKSSEKEMQDLAAELTRDVEAQAAATPEVPTEPEKAAYALRESRVPSSRFGRLWQYAGLGTSMAMGAVGESLRRVTGSAASTTGSLMLSPGNLEILVAKLSRMRGAALKLGQMISFQGMLSIAIIRTY